MVSDLVDDESWVRINRKMELVSVPDSAGGNAMIGISYLSEEQAATVRARIQSLSQDFRYDGAFGKEAFFQEERMIVLAKVAPSSDVIEINTYEQLRELDENSNQLKSDAIMTAAAVLNAKTEEITNIVVLKKGMTNRSFLFTCRDKKYIMRIPGEATNQLIDRKKEEQVYHAILGKGLCDEVIYINASSGYKITKFIESARVCDPFDEADVTACMKKLRSFHRQKLTVDHEFDLFAQIQLYESLWQGKKSAYKDYEKTKENVWSLKPYIEARVDEKVLTHIDSVPDNFLFVDSDDRKDSVLLINWEYAGMQDPHVDLAMFCIYSLYDRAHVEQLLQAYFPEGCSGEIRIKIYCYIAVLRAFVEQLV